MSEVSQLTEKVSDALLDESDIYTVVLLDQTSKEINGEHRVKLKNPFEFDLNRFVPNDRCTDLPRFFNLASDLITDAQRREGIKENQFVELKEDFNAYEFNQHGNEVITWKVIVREPARMDMKAMGRPQRRPLFSYDVRFAAEPDKVIVVDSMPIDHVLEFTCWSKSAPLANRRALWLEKLFIDHSWAFIVKGVEKFYWEKRLADTFMEVSGQRLYQRANRFFVRLREFHTLAYPAINNFNFEVNLTNC